MKNMENQTDQQHLGFSAIGEKITDHGFSLNSDSEITNEEIIDIKAPRTDCTILWWNGQYQKPNIDVTKGRIYVTLGVNVQKIQLRQMRKR
ncbi:MAG: hypothetical protein Q8S11_10435 [Daejeonella sp.]|nr:hypothetical protein [Daejeonella sp.]